jgi:predicted TIM-barrel fold metal-dependent hydrolase
MSSKPRSAVSRGAISTNTRSTFSEGTYGVTPFDHDDIGGLAEAIGIDRVLFGSDHPHADCLAETIRILDSLKAFNSAGVRRIVHDNARQLVGRREQSARHPG